MNGRGNIYKAFMIMAVCVWAYSGPVGQITPKTLKPGFWIIVVCCVLANPPVTLHAASVHGIIVF